MKIKLKVSFISYKKTIATLYWVMDGKNIDPYFAPNHPHPRRQQKSPARGAKELRENTLLINFYDWYVKRSVQHHVSEEERQALLVLFSESAQQRLHRTSFPLATIHIKKRSATFWEIELFFTNILRDILCI